MAISDDARRDTDWDDFSTRLAAYIKGLGARSDEVEDITQECVRLLLSPETALWDPTRALLLTYGRGIARKLVSGAARRHFRRRRGDRQSIVGSEEEAPRTPERDLESHRLMQRLRTAVEGDESATLVLDAFLEGRERLPDLRGLPLTDLEISNAKRRLRRRIAEIREEIATASSNPSLPIRKKTKLARSTSGV